MKRQGNTRKIMARKKSSVRAKNLAKYNISNEGDVDYKNLTLLQKFLNSRGKMVPRRVSGVTAKVQRRLAVAIKRARFLALLTTGGVKK